jgi:hypothetical protein
MFQNTEKYFSCFKNLPLKPKISSTEDSYQEMMFVEKFTKRHLENLRHFEIFPLTRIDGLGSLNNILPLTFVKIRVSPKL